MSAPASYGIRVIACVAAAYPPRASCFANLDRLDRRIWLYAEPSKEAPVAYQQNGAWLRGDQGHPLVYWYTRGC